MHFWKRVFELKVTTKQPATGEERDVSNPPPDSADQPVVVDRFSWLVEQARNGNSDVLPELREILESRPDLWQFYGDLGRGAELAWIEAIVGKDLFWRENIGRKLDQMRKDLGIDQASPLEKLLIKRISMNWVRVHHADMAAAHAMKNSNSIKILGFWQKRLTDAERRYMASIGLLATLRRLLPSSAIPESPGAEKALPATDREAEIPESDLTPPLRVVEGETDATAVGRGQVEAAKRGPSPSMRKPTVA
jgi:hypothetical protein